MEKSLIQQKWRKALVQLDLKTHFSADFGTRSVTNQQASKLLLLLFKTHNSFSNPIIWAPHSWSINIMATRMWLECYGICRGWMILGVLFPTFSPPNILLIYIGHLNGNFFLCICVYCVWLYVLFSSLTYWIYKSQRLLFRPN